MVSIADLLLKYGPMTGKELSGKTDENIFGLWKACREAPDIISRAVGERYLRFDRHVTDYARLSPSILREFINYTVVGHVSQTAEIEAKAASIRKEIEYISRKKFELAREVMLSVVAAQSIPELVLRKTFFIIAGDVAYGMAHTEPRPEYSSGKLVNGSDLDIVVVYKEDLPDSMVEGLDREIYNRKAYLLRNPMYREEIDYVIKDVSLVRKQLEFGDFKSMIASKVLDEGKYLCGSSELFNEIRGMIDAGEVSRKLADLKRKAEADREEAVKRLLTYDSAGYDDEAMKLFYTTEEKEEFF